MKCYVLLERSHPVQCAASYEELIDYQVEKKRITANCPVWDASVCMFVPVCQMFTQVTDNWIEGIKLAGIDNYNDLFGELYDYYIHESEFFTS